jgi:hypothetical protein
MPTARCAAVSIVEHMRASREVVRASVVGAVAVLATLFPLLRDEPHDSFPLSNYPMFTSAQPATTSFVRAVAVADDGSQDGLPPEIAGGTVEVIHANRTLRRAVREGRADEMCEEIAERAAARPDVVEVLIVSERYDVIDALRADDPDAVSRTVLARCPTEAR